MSQFCCHAYCPTVMSHASPTHPFSQVPIHSNITYLLLQALSHVFGSSLQCVAGLTEEEEYMAVHRHWCADANKQFELNWYHIGTVSCPIPPNSSLPPNLFQVWQYRGVDDVPGMAKTCKPNPVPMQMKRALSGSSQDDEIPLVTERQHKSHLQLPADDNEESNGPGPSYSTSLLQYITFLYHML
ncbi:hypothetical protein V8E53_000146 [Lactarius tabidus]